MTNGHHTVVDEEPQRPGHRRSWRWTCTCRKSAGCLVTERLAIRAGKAHERLAKPIPSETVDEHW